MKVQKLVGFARESVKLLEEQKKYSGSVVPMSTIMRSTSTEVV